MVDRAPVSLTVHDCPAHRVGAILVVVEEFRLATGLAAADEAGGRRLALGAAYVGGDMCLGADDEIVKRLQRYAPDACWTLHQDPKCENPGMLHVHVPGLGTYHGTCDADGQPTPGVHAVRASLDDPATLSQALRELFGLAHLDAVAALRRADVVDDERERFVVFWRQRTGQGWIPLDEPGPIITFTGPPSPAEHTPPFDQLDPALLQAGWAVLGPWTRYSAGGVWSTQACQVDEQQATPPAVAAPVAALAW